MKINMNTVLESFNDNSVEEEIEISIEDDRISISLVNDSLIDDRGQYVVATYPRSVTVELRHDGEIQVLLHKTEKEEPAVIRLNTKGEMDIVHTGST